MPRLKRRENKLPDDFDDEDNAENDNCPFEGASKNRAREVTGENGDDDR